MMRRRQRGAAHNIWRDRKRPKLIAMLKTDDLILGGDIGQRGYKLAGILWYPALPIGVQASIYSDSHDISNLESAAWRPGLRMLSSCRHSNSMRAAGMRAIHEHERLTTHGLRSAARPQADASKRPSYGLINERTTRGTTKHYFIKRCWARLYPTTKRQFAYQS
jgi:hypothetical protein